MMKRLFFLMTWLCCALSVTAQEAHSLDSFHVFNNALEIPFRKAFITAKNEAGQGTSRDMYEYQATGEYKQIERREYGYHAEGYVESTSYDQCNLEYDTCVFRQVDQYNQYGERIYSRRQDYSSNSETGILTPIFYSVDTTLTFAEDRPISTKYSSFDQIPGEVPVEQPYSTTEYVRGENGEVDTIYYSRYSFMWDAMLLDRVTVYTYDEAGNRILIEYFDPEGNKTTSDRRIYDDQNRLLSSKRVGYTEGDTSFYATTDYTYTDLYRLNEYFYYDTNADTVLGGSSSETFYLVEGVTDSIANHNWNVATRSWQYSSSQKNYYSLLNSVKDRFEEATYQLYPNPATQRLYVQIGLTGNKTRQIRIFDATGRRLQQFATTDETIEIDVSSFPNGLYYFSLDNQLPGKFMVQH